MKKISFILSFLISFISLSNAQKRKEYKWGCSIAINNIYTPMGLIGDATIGLSTDGFWNGGGQKTDKSYSLSLIPKYKIGKDLFLRFEIGITKIKETRFLSVSSDMGTAYSNTYPLSWDTIEQKSSRYIPCIQWNAYSDRRIEMHIGLSIPNTFYSNLEYNSYHEIRNKNPDTLVSAIHTYRSVPGGYSIGIGAIAGFDFYLLKRISIGAEFSNSFVYYNIGGDAAIKQVLLSPSGNSGEGMYAIPESYKGMRLEKIFSSYNITVYF